MLRMTFSATHTLDSLELEMVEFVSKNIVSIIDVYIDKVEDGVADAIIGSFFPRSYYEKKSERCKDILYSLRDRMNSSVLYNEMQPTYNNLLFHVLEDWIVYNKDMDDSESLYFPLPIDLKNRILSDPRWEDEFEPDKTESQEPYIIKMLESVEEYINNCFDDTDFLEEDLRAIIQLKKTNPILSDAMGIAGELEEYIDLMPLDVLEDYKQIEMEVDAQKDYVRVFEDLLQISSAICNNSNYSEHSTENEINDYYRDVLRVKGDYEVADQSRHGVSSTGKNAGEVDLLLLRNGQETAIVESLKVSTIDRKYIDEHIRKAIINYNALGTPVFILIYSMEEKFQVFYKRLRKYLFSYDFPLEVYKEIMELKPSNASVKALGVMLRRNEIDFPVTFIVVNLFKGVM